VIRARLRRTRDGRFLLRLPGQERELLRSLPAQLRQLIATGDASTRRLFPPAYSDDDEAEAEYRRLAGGQLLESHQGALQILEETVDATELDEDQLTAWLGALNDLRLVLGTKLEVTEDFQPLPPSDPRAPAMATYVYLSMLQENLVEALAASL
jgi:hypothetical protein